LNRNRNRAPVLTSRAAVQFIRSGRAEGLSVVFTNGCFDILHPGHLEILEKASNMGDLLVVGVNSDDSVKRLKGPGRPVQPLENRASVLSCIRFVDCVVPFEEDTPLELIRLLLPDILVKGGDYTPETVVGADEVASNGGTVCIVPLIEGFSTTGILRGMD